MNLALYVGLLKKTTSVAREVFFYTPRRWNFMQMAHRHMPMRIRKEFHHLRQLTPVKTAVFELVIN